MWITTLLTFLLSWHLVRASIQTNTTIDDASPLVTYRAQVDRSLSGFNSTLLNNGTVTFIAATPDDSPTIAMNFTGTAVYIFVAYPSGHNESFTSGFIARIDDVPSGGWAVDQTAPLYNHLAYRNTALSDGLHSLVIQIQPQWELYFDYMIYTSGDPDPEPTANSTSGSVTPQPTSRDPDSEPTANSTSASVTPQPTSSISLSSARKKFPIGAVIGGTVGGLLLIALLATPCLLRRRAMIKKQKPNPFIGGLYEKEAIGETKEKGAELSPVTPFVLKSPPPPRTSKQMQESKRSALSLGIPDAGSHIGGMVPSPLSATSDPALMVMAQEMRRLTASVQRLETGIPEAQDGGPILQRPPAYGIGE